MQNIEKAKKEIEKIEAKEAAEANGESTEANGVNGKKSDDKAVAEVTSELKDASIEDKKEEGAAAAETEAKA